MELTCGTLCKDSLHGNMHWDLTTQNGFVLGMSMSAVACLTLIDWSQVNVMRFVRAPVTGHTSQARLMQQWLVVAAACH